MSYMSSLPKVHGGPKLDGTDSNKENCSPGSHGATTVQISGQLKCTGPGQDPDDLEG